MSMVIHGARLAAGPEKIVEASIEVVDGRISCIDNQSAQSLRPNADSTSIDLSGYLLMPGLINAHDHLQFSLFPRVANPPYQNYIEWGEDIHRTCGELIALHKAVPRDVRLWWGGIRNLLCGVTSVCHHDQLRPELRRKDFPVRVLQRYGWAHSLALGGDLYAARAATPGGAPFIIHACEGVDDRARKELWELDQYGLLDADTILVHALALDSEGAALLQRRKVSVVVCPSSNHFLFKTTPDISLLASGGRLALGSDSPLTAAGDLLDEVRFATKACNLTVNNVYRMVTSAPAEMLRLNHSEVFDPKLGTMDLIAVCDTGHSPADKLQMLTARDVELVMVRGQVQLASENLLERLPRDAKEELEALDINGTLRWLRAPVNKLMEQAEEILGPGKVRLGGRPVHGGRAEVVPYAC